MALIRKLGKAFLCAILERQVVRLRQKHDFTVVAVVGSVGKTSTKFAIANILATEKNVRFQEGNYNDRLTVPLVIFGQDLPGLFNLVAWVKIFFTNRRQIKGTYDLDYVVVELGTDGPGQIEKFAYLRPELTVVTAIADEHMEFFGTLDAVAHEELAVATFSKALLVNIDDTDPRYVTEITCESYGLAELATHRLITVTSRGLAGSEIVMKLGDKPEFTTTVPMLGKQGARIALAAAATAHMLGETNETIAHDLSQLQAFAGRMRVLDGVHGSRIIDDSYNASPVAVKAGLDVLYSQDSPRRIAILGNMNELGDHSPDAHTDVGNYCRPDLLDYVITIGQDAKTYLAVAAERRGCKVKTFDSPYEAGLFIKERLIEGAVVLVEGSQNRVFAEEAVKMILARPEDVDKLVRQSDYWMGVKKSQFGAPPA